MIGGVDWQEHNANLEATLKRIEDHNLTLRKEKCEFGKTTMEFHGHTFTSEGLRPSSDKIRAVEECEPPRNREELISFLQMLAYLSRYISKFLSRCEPLRRLTRENAQFIWTNEQQRAFEDLKVIHIPDKQNITDYMSRHALPYDESDVTATEKQVKAIVEIEQSIVLSKIEKETKEDTELQRVKEAIHTGIWSRNDPVLKPYIDLQSELYEAERVILRLNKIVAPASLRKKIIRVAHNQGHLGISKTKEMIHQKYWWPGMNIQIEESVKGCFECQISTNAKRTEPAKMTELPTRPWSSVEVDFCGPFPNGKYVLDVTDQYSQYPEVEFTTSTSFEATRKKLKKIFSIHGIPETLQSDNGPPFNSTAFAEFAKESGFYHKRITPRHPEVTVQVEGFNNFINKTMTIAKQAGTDQEEAIYDMLQAYRSTPHPATKLPPYQLLMNREVRTTLDHFPTETQENDTAVRASDSRYKNKCKEYHDQRHKTTIHKMK